MKKTKIIHSNKLAGFLLMSGCKLLEVKANLKNPIFNIYVFVDNDKLQLNLTTYMNERQNAIPVDDSVLTLTVPTLEAEEVLTNS
jgi:hypothetical protein